MKANAWHHRSDALSSVGTAIGIGGAILLGERWAVLDPIASIAVGALIVKVAIDLLKNGMGELMEQSLPDEVENEILDIVRRVPGVAEPPLRHRNAHPHGRRHPTKRSPRQSLRNGTPAEGTLRRGNAYFHPCGAEGGEGFCMRKIVD